MALPFAAAAPLVAELAWHGTIFGERGTTGVLQAILFGVAALLLRETQFNGALERRRDILTLFGAVAAAAAGTALLRGIPHLTAQWPPAWTSTLASLFFSQVVAGMAVTPVLLVWLARGAAPWMARPSLETLAQIASVMVLGWEVFGQFANAEIRFFYLLFLPFTWIATRHGVAGVTVALAATYVGLMMSHMTIVHEEAAVVELQVRMLALAATSLALGAIVSERRATEEKLQARQNELAHVLRLNIGWEMASGLAHELNQPMTAAMSYGEAGLRLLRGTGPNLEPNLEKAIFAFTKGLAQIEQAGEIIRRLRNFMKKGEIQVEIVAIDEIVDDAVQLAASEIAASGIAIQALVPPQLPCVLCDKTQIVQVILNLLRNAHQAITGAGAMGGLIHISALQSGGEIEFTVRDDGPGINAEVLARLFRPFVTTKAAGMGLGLSLSKSIIEAHNGRLWTEPPTHGAIFKFTLPLATQNGD